MNNKDKDNNIESNFISCSGEELWEHIDKELEKKDNKLRKGSNKSKDNKAMDFNPILESDCENRKDLVVTESVSSTEIVEVYNEDVLSMQNFLKGAEEDTKDIEFCKKRFNKVIEIIEQNIETMSMRELIDYAKFLDQREDRKINSMDKRYNYILKTEVSKRLLAGSHREQNKVEKKDKNKIKDMMELFKETHLESKKDGDSE